MVLTHWPVKIKINHCLFFLSRFQVPCYTERYTQEVQSADKTYKRNYVWDGVLALFWNHKNLYWAAPNYFIVQFNTAHQLIILLSIVFHDAVIAQRHYPRIFANSGRRHFLASYPKRPKCLTEQRTERRQFTLIFRRQFAFQIKIAWFRQGLWSMLGVNIICFVAAVTGITEFRNFSIKSSPLLRVARMQTRSSLKVAKG